MQFLWFTNNLKLKRVNCWDFWNNNTCIRMIVGRTSYLSVGHCSKPTFFLKRLYAPEKFSILFPSFLVLFLVFLFLLDFLGHLLLFLALSSLHHHWVFLLLLVLWKKFNMLVSVLHGNPTTGGSWPNQWGCYGGWSLPCMLCMVTEHAIDCSCLNTVS